ncbi:MAG: HAD family hydrolase [Pseudomonadales bacterium]|nr:HAD family hydrolase [Pseudomonadales bacterium]
MPDVQALAIDLDGTLLVGESLSARNRDAVKRAFDAGIHVIIATARWRQMAERIASEIGLHHTPVIACSGAQVYCTEIRKDIYDARLPQAFVEQLYDLCNEHRCIASATVDAHTWLKIDQKPAPEYLSEELKWVEKLPRPETDADHVNLPRIATVQGSSTIALVRELHERDFTDQVNIFDSIGPSGRTVITITARGADKGIALQKACDHLDIHHDSVVAFGDAHNDIEMFKVAGQSVAMGQADDSVKQAATHVTAHHEEDGVAEFIETHLLK